ncbi:hypothetical protein KIW84_052273 [Lathyrus oleraceus]|uniref:ATPase F1/V1/A1 complex alpha/beta subunit N-terminal domain-containing protein n=1 Tax=Pisum sativum TaxID=3888 RepID=A0A9D4WPM9_PEA|nr:hypothetical protein KIW84_052273 [Pisum sativum]
MSSAENYGFGVADANLADTDTERKRLLDGIPGLRESFLYRWAIKSKTTVRLQRGRNDKLRIEALRHRKANSIGILSLTDAIESAAVGLTGLGGYESRITNFYTNFKVDEIGRVVSVVDGIARVYGLNEIQAGELVEFASSVKGKALNLENENVGIVVFGSDTSIKEGDLVKRTGSIMDL